MQPALIRVMSPESARPFMGRQFRLKQFWTLDLAPKAMVEPVGPFFIFAEKGP